MRKSLLSLAILALCAAPSFAGEYNKVLSVGDKAPSFDGIPAVMGDQESTLAMSDIKEDVVVVVFLANHCPAVVANEDRLVDLVNDYKGKSVKVVGICCTGAPTMKAMDDISAIKKNEKNKSFTYGYDEAGKVGKAYGAVVTPQFFVLDKERKVAYTGALDNSVQNEAKVTTKYVRNAIDALLAGKAIEKTETRASGCGIPYAK